MGFVFYVKENDCVDHCIQTFRKCLEQLDSQAPKFSDQERADIFNCQGGARFAVLELLQLSGGIGSTHI